MPASTRHGPAVFADVVLLDLKSCLVNLPPFQVTALENANTVRELSDLKFE